MTCLVVYVANTNLIEIRGLKSAVEDAFINDADVSLTVKNAVGEEIEGESGGWPVTMAYIDASDGEYRGVLSDALELVDGVTYYAHIDANAGADRIGHWEYAFVAKTRRAA